MRLLTRLVAAAVMVGGLVGVAGADAYRAKPKLVVILVLDQFRGDYLDRYRADFKTVNGFNLFLKKGVHFTDCYYDYANLVTAAGHSTIGTGAYTDAHRIPVNEWWETGPTAEDKPRLVSSVSDDRYAIVGAPEGTEISPGASPHREAASTVGDELELATGGKAKVFGVSFKDRAAILTSGHASKGAFWTDHDSGKFVTSTYWMPKLPEWAEAFNGSGRAADARRESGVMEGSFYEKVGATPAAVAYQIEFAKALVDGEHLGENDVTDMLTLSISNTDILGHKVGPDSPLQRQMIDAVDVQLDSFFTFLDKKVGLQNVVVALTADHGVAPTMDAAMAAQMPARALKSDAVLKALDDAMERRFKRQGKYVLGGEYPYIQLNPAAFEMSGIGEAEAEEAAAEALRAIFVADATKPADGARAPDAVRTPESGGDEPVDLGVKSAATAVPSGRRPEPLTIGSVYPVIKMRNGEIPNTELGNRILHSYSPYVGWAVFLNFGAYQYAGPETGAAHYSSYAYDRHVPLDFYGAQFIPGTYHDRVAPVDIAATLASLLRTNQPSGVEGRILTKVLKPDVEDEGTVVAPAAKGRRGRGK